MAATDRTQQILPGGQSSAPFTYTLPGSTIFTLLAVKATLDGTGAAGDFLPCVQLVSDAGVVMAQVVGSTVTAGDSVTATFYPFEGSSASTPVAAGWQFNTYPQDGGWGYVETDDAIDATTLDAIKTEFPQLGTFFGLLSAALMFVDQSGAGLVLYAPNGPLDIYGGGDNVNIRGAFDGKFSFAGQAQVSGGGGVVVSGGTNSFVELDRPTGGQIVLGSLPTSDPGITGALWNNGGVVNISP